MTTETINFGNCACGTAGQLFRTGKCAHCYIAELESTKPEERASLVAQPSCGATPERS